MSKLKSKCTLCNKEFEYYPSEKNGKYCSTNCCFLHKKQLSGLDKPVKCSTCSTFFMPDKNRKIYCSKECGVSASAKTRERTYTFYCKNCGIEKQSHRKDRITYCSQECYYELISGLADEWKKERVCVECSKGYSPTYKIQKYCSGACSAVVRGRKQTEENTAIINCGWCKKEFRRGLSSIGSDNNFCSIGCFHLFLRDGNPMTIIKKCKNCKEEFELLYIDREQEFCSKSCAKSGEFHHYFGREGPTKGVRPWTFGLTKETDTDCGIK